ncbi:hypothetical protein [Levilactobacillus brevis]|uniref:hypothetical protein n=1 Tax=Levilactobacillus brevis TaxID=1580 RepID=UPI000463BD25|nr:hypothetical protein [Levilactobacillus brevis]QCZ46665.1 hypothetical protein UCCLB556_1784 [Levilactobacillus brevis]
MNVRYERAKYLGLLGISLFSFSLLQSQSTTAHAATNSLDQSSVVSDASQEKTYTGIPKSNTLKSADSNGQVSTESTGTGSSTGIVSDATKVEKSVTETTSVNDATGTDSSDNVTSGTNSTGANNDQTGIADPTKPTVADPKNLVVIKKNDSTVHLDNQLKISTDSVANIKKVTASNPDNSAYNDTTKTVTITDPTATDMVTAEYGVVGTYQGKNVTAKVTVGNLVKHTEDHPAPSNLPANEVQIKFHPDFGGGIETYNVAQDEVTIAFFDEQGNPIIINKDGYITVGSLNGPSVNTMGNEYVDYDNPNTSVYITEDSVVQYQANPVTNTGDAYVGTSSDFTDKLGAPTSENGAVTFQLAGNSFTFLNGTTRYTLKNKNHHWSYALTTFNSATVAPAQTPKPVLSVDKTSAKAGDVVNYQLDQQVNTLGEDTLLRYQSWIQTVTLPSEVTYQQANLLDSNGNVISDALITYDSKTHQVSVTLPSDYLQSTMPLTGETYSLKIKTRVNAGVSNGENGSASGASTIDKAANVSDNVDTVYVAPITEVPNDTSDPLARTHTLTLKLVNLSTGKVISEQVSKKDYQSQYIFQVPNLQKRELVVLWNDFSEKQLVGTMPDHDLMITVPYSELIYKEKRSKGISVIWAYDASGKTRFLQFTLPDDSNLVTFYKLNMLDNGEYITDPMVKFTSTSSQNHSTGKKGTSKSLFKFSDNQKIQLWSDGTSNGFFRSDTGKLYSYSFRDGKIVVKSIKNAVISKSNRPANEKRKLGKNVKAKANKRENLINNTRAVVIGENKNNRIVVVNGTRELPQTNENSNLIVSLIGLLLLPVFFLGKLITERFIK